MTSSASVALGPFTVGRIALGCMRMTNTDPGSTLELLATAVETGANLIDTADIYGNDFGSAEEILGEAFRREPPLREQLVVATKGGIIPGVPYDSSATYLMRAVDASRSRLQCEVIDLYQVHRPDLFVHPQEVASAMVEMRELGWVREFGVSNYSPSQVEALARHLPFPLASHQFQYSLLHLDPVRDGTFDQVMSDDLVPLIWSPLAAGRLAGEPPQASPLSSLLQEIALEVGTTPVTLALAFILAHPSAPVAIIGTQSPERLLASQAALDFHLDRSLLYRLWQTAEGVPLP